MLLDYGRIVGRAAYIRHKCNLFGAKPAYSIRRIIETAFPKIHVTGASLPDGVVEIVEKKGNRQTIFYNRKYNHAMQRVGIAHALYHLIADLKKSDGIAECNIALRALEQAGKVTTDPVEISCDLFAGELLVPFDVLDKYAPDDLTPRTPAAKAALDDELDHLSSRFNVPREFMEWRLHDLVHLRATHLALK